MSLVFAACARLAGNRPILPGAVRRAKLHRSAHAGLDHRDQASDLQPSLHQRNEVSGLELVVRILQVVERAAVGDGAHQRRQFERSLRNLLAEAAQHADSAIARRGRWKGPRLFARDIQPGPLSIPEHVGVMADRLETQFRSQRGEIIVVRVG